MFEFFISIAFFVNCEFRFAINKLDVELLFFVDLIYNPSFLAFNNKKLIKK